MNTIMTNADVTTNAASNAEPNAASSAASEIIEGTGWSWHDAAAMAKECAREDRLFGRKSGSNGRRPRSSKMSNRSAAAFLKQTGMTIEDAAAMAKDAMREQRLFGSPRLYAAS